MIIIPTAKFSRRHTVYTTFHGLKVKQSNKKFLNKFLFLNARIPQYEKPLEQKSVRSS